MDEKIDKAIELILTQFRTGASPKCEESLKFSQAILNLAHAKQTLAGKKKPNET